MTLQLLIPGLVWPSPAARELTGGLSLPALETLLRLGRCLAGPPQSSESALARAFDLDEDSFPVAPLRRLGELDTDDTEGEWICADPVHLHFARERMLLADAGDLALDPTETKALIDAINAHFTDLEAELLRFEARSPQRWYLRLKSPPRARFKPLNEAIGRPVENFLPQGDDEQRWCRLINECQILLHNHPVNQARRAQGRPTINSLWFWGPGHLPRRTAAPAPVICTDDPLARGLARAAGMQVLEFGDKLPSQDAMVFATSLLRPSLYLDIDSWRTELEKLEASCFKPALTALRKRRLSAVHISAPGDRATLELHIRPLDLYRLWRKPCTLESLLPG
jgi:hypothetical protein